MSSIHFPRSLSGIDSTTRWSNPEYMRLITRSARLRLNVVNRPISITRFLTGIAVEPGEQQALTYLNRKRKLFWAGICLFPSSYPARYFRNEGFSLPGKRDRVAMQLWLQTQLCKNLSRFGCCCRMGRQLGHALQRREKWAPAHREGNRTAGNHEGCPYSPG